MATVMLMKWSSVTPEQYDAALGAVNWEGDPPDGGIFHVAWFDGGLNVADVWESADDFNRFANERLMPGIAHLGIEGEPDVTFHDAHRYFDAAAKRAEVST
jgi:hypothetical protein